MAAATGDVGRDDQFGKTVPSGLIKDDRGVSAGRDVEAADPGSGPARRDPGKPVKPTIIDKAAACPLDQVGRQFHAPEPNMLCISCFTHIATWGGFIDVAFLSDVYASYGMGWRDSRTALASFVLDALNQSDP